MRGVARAAHMLLPAVQQPGGGQRGGEGAAVVVANNGPSGGLGRSGGQVWHGSRDRGGGGGGEWETGELRGRWRREW